MVDVVLGFVCAPREGSRLLHLDMVRAMLLVLYTNYRILHTNDWIGDITSGNAWPSQNRRIF